MSLPPRRIKLAKVEGRDLPETTKKTMEAFKAFSRRLLTVGQEELKEQERLYREASPKRRSRVTDKS